jgi:hypothetical protein
MKFECHITLKPEHEEKAKQVGKQYGFKNSKITGDEIMGDGVFFYLTKTGADFEKVQKDMYACGATLKLNKIPYLRMKIELILFDHRER